MVIILPHPPKILSPNGGRGHIMAHATAVKRWKASVILACKLAGVTSRVHGLNLNYGVSWRHKTKKKPDSDNIVSSLKSTLDGIFDHFGVNDNVAEIDFVERYLNEEDCVSISFNGVALRVFDLRPFMPIEKKRVVKKGLTTDKANNQSVVRKSRTGGRKESK